MSEIIPFPGGTSAGGGPEDPMLEERVGRLEVEISDIKIKVDRIDGALARLEPAIRDITTELKDQRKQIFDVSMKVSGIEGQLKSAPNWIQLIGLTIATWTAGAGIVFTLTKFIHP